MILKRTITHDEEIEITEDELISLIEKCSSIDIIDFTDKILSTFTWMDARSRERKLEILEMLDKHKNIVIGHLGKERY